MIAWDDWLSEVDPRYDGPIENYIEFLSEILEEFPHIDSLSNKVLLTAPSILEKTLNHINTNVNRITRCQLLLNGNMSFLFSKRNRVPVQKQKITDTSMDKTNTSLYLNIEGHKHNKLYDMLSTTKRLVACENVMNDSSLKFPIDGLGFVCPLCCKEMRQAGTSCILSRDVITCPKIDDPNNFNIIYHEYNDYLKPNKIYKTYEKDLKIKEMQDKDGDINMIDDLKEMEYKKIIFLEKFVSVYQNMTRQEKFQTFLKIKKLFFGFSFVSNDVMLLEIAKYYSIVHEIPLCDYEMEMYKDDIGDVVELSEKSVNVKKFTYNDFVFIKKSLNNMCELFINDDILNVIFVNKYQMRYNVNDGILTTIRERSDMFPSKLQKPLRIVFNGFVTPFVVLFSWEIYLYLKSVCRYHSMMMFENYLYIFYCENVLLKYIHKYDIFMSPHEMSHLFGNRTNLDLNAYLSTFVDYMPKEFSLTTATKNTVTYSNIKGSVYKFNNIEEFELFRSAPGFNSSINFNNKYDYTDLAILSTNNKLSPVLAKYHNYLDEKYGINEEEEPKELQLYVAFGHIPEVVEDGFILDENFAKNGLTININIKLNLRLCQNETIYELKNTKMNKNFQNTPANKKNLIATETQYIPINKIIGDRIILVGILATLGDFKLVQNKKISCCVTKIKDINYYSIGYNLENAIEENNVYNIQSSANWDEGPVLSIKLNYNVKFGVGTKLCNFGQKAEISKVADLSEYACYTRDGVCVKPQLMMSGISVLGRTASGMVTAMLKHPRRAVNEFGGLTSPIPLFVSTIHSSTKLSRGITRLDTLKTSNGFDGNELAATCSVLNSQHQMATKRYEAFAHTLALNMHRGLFIKFN